MESLPVLDVAQPREVGVSEPHLYAHSQVKIQQSGWVLVTWSGNRCTLEWLDFRTEINSTSRDRGDNWKQFKRDWTYYETASKINKEEGPV